MTNLPTLKKTNELAKLNNSLSIINKLLPAKDISNKEWWNNLPEIWKKILIGNFYGNVSPSWRNAPFFHKLEPELKNPEDINRIIQIKEVFYCNGTGCNSFACSCNDNGCNSTCANELSELPDLRILKSLKKLHLSGVNFKNVDFGDLLPDNIEELTLNDACIKDISKIKVSDSLKKLDLSGNSIASLDGFKANNILDINLDDNYLQMIHIDNFSDCKRVILSNNKIRTIDFSSKKTKIENLEIQNNCISDVSFLISTPNLKCLDVGCSNLGSQKLLIITSLNQLEDLIVNSCGLDHEDLNIISKLHNLRKLDIRNGCFDPTYSSMYNTGGGSNRFDIKDIILLREKLPNCIIESKFSEDENLNIENNKTEEKNQTNVLSNFLNRFFK